MNRKGGKIQAKNKLEKAGTIEKIYEIYLNVEERGEEVILLSL